MRSTSFPYLTVAKLCGIDYWQVLQFSELLNDYPPKPGDWYLEPWQVHTIMAWKAEYCRRLAQQEGL